MSSSPIPKPVRYSESGTSMSRPARASGNPSIQVSDRYDHVPAASVHLNR